MKSGFQFSYNALEICWEYTIVLSAQTYKVHIWKIIDTKLLIFQYHATVEIGLFGVRSYTVLVKLMLVSKVMFIVLSM